MRCLPTRKRSGIAATEMAIIAPILITFLIGTWEVGRYITVQNLLDNAAREGGRMAASCAFFSSNNFNATGGGTITLSAPSTGVAYEVQKRVLLYLSASGVTTTGATVTVTNTGSTSSPKNWTYTYNQSGSGSGTGYDPSAAATQLDQISVSVTLPYSNVTWTPTSTFISKTAVMHSSSSWLALCDTTFTVSTTIPTQPLQSTDPIP